MIQRTDVKFRFQIGYDYALIPDRGRDYEEKIIKLVSGATP
jgi:hypothetical protein